jgi:hypothetical protein
MAICETHVMTTEKISTRQFWILFLITSVLLVAYGLFEERSFIFGPAVLETGDFAANGLQILEAKHWHELLGNYSRWKLNHPGPFFFYLYSFGERLFFDFFKVTNSPHQAHVITGIIFQSACIAFAMCLFTSLTERRLTLYIGLACAVFFIQHTLGALTSIWPPYVLFGPFVLLIVSCAATSLGRSNILPIAVFATCVLCHGHVAQPLMALPLLFIASAIYFSRELKQGKSTLGIIRALQVQLWISLGIIAIFFIPILIDLSNCPDCNARRIIDYLHSNHDKKPSLRQAINYLFSYLVFDHYPQWIDNQRHMPFFTGRVIAGLVLIGVLWILPRVLKEKISEVRYQALKAVALFTILALILALVWAKKITGPLYEFNSFFIYGIMFVGAATILTALSLAVRDGKQATMASISVSCAILAMVVRGPALPVFSSSFVFLAPDQAINNAIAPPTTALINQENSENWSSTITLALWMRRHGVDFMVPPEWAHVFGWNHSFDANRILRLGNQFQIWEPGSDLMIASKRFFDLSAFCRISESSRPPVITALPMPLDDVRNKCEVTAIGIGKAGGWTIGHLVALQFVGQHAGYPVRLNFDVSPFLSGGKLTKQDIHTYVNGSAVGNVELTSERVVSFSVPPAIWNASKVVTLVLMLPDAASPKSLDVSVDSRIIGLRFKGMGIQYDNADLQADSQAAPLIQR